MEELIRRLRDCSRGKKPLPRGKTVSNVYEETVNKMREIFPTLTSSVEIRAALTHLKESVFLLFPVVSTKEHVKIIAWMGYKAEFDYLFNTIAAKDSELTFYFLSKINVNDIALSYLTAFICKELRRGWFDRKVMDRIIDVHPDFLFTPCLLEIAFSSYSDYPVILEYIIQEIGIIGLARYCQKHGGQFYSVVNYIPAFAHLLTWPQFHINNPRRLFEYARGQKEFVEFLEDDERRRGSARARLVQMGRELKKANRTLEELQKVLEEGDSLVNIALSVTFNELKLNMLKQIEIYDRLAFEHDFHILDVSKWRTFDYQLVYRN